MCVYIYGQLIRVIKTRKKTKLENVLLIVKCSFKCTYVIIYLKI